MSAWVALRVWGGGERGRVGTRSKRELFCTAERLPPSLSGGAAARPPIHPAATHLRARALVGRRARLVAREALELRRDLRALDVAPLLLLGGGAAARGELLEQDAGAAAALGEALLVALLLMPPFSRRDGARQ